MLALESINTDLIKICFVFGDCLSYADIHIHQTRWYHFTLVEQHTAVSKNVSLKVWHFPQMSFSPCWNSQYSLLSPTRICVKLSSKHKAISKGEKEKELWQNQVQIAYQECNLFSLLTQSWLQSFTEEEGLKAKCTRQKLGFWKGEWKWMRLAGNLFRSKADESSSSLVLLSMLPLVDAVFWHNVNSFWQQTFWIFSEISQCPSITREGKHQQKL